MRKKLQSYIPHAIKAIQETRIGLDGKIIGTYNGFISSFGAGIVQAGILPAVIFFETAESTEGADKYRICQALYWMKQSTDGNTIQPSDLAKDSLSNYILDHDLQYDRKFLKEMTQYAVALKIAMRTFKKVEKS
ncbi:MAG: type III-B CRISPR module-associated protein Cmr5 [Bacteroidota bacterium]